MFWKVAVLSNQNRIRFAWCLLIFHLYQSFALYLLTKKKKENMIMKYMWHAGEANKFYGVPNELRMPADRKKNYVRYSNFHQVRRNKRTSMIHTNWWCRDQNFRKYFDMRKRHDIRPSISGFYHDDLYDKSVKQNQEWADLRASKASR